MADHDIAQQVEANCHFIKDDGVPCKRRVSSDETYCWQHSHGLRHKWRSLTRNQSVVFLVGVLGLLATIGLGLPSAYWSYRGTENRPTSTPLPPTPGAVPPAGLPEPPPSPSPMSPPKVAPKPSESKPGLRHDEETALRKTERFVALLPFTRNGTASGVPIDNNLDDAYADIFNYGLAMLSTRANGRRLQGEDDFADRKSVV
jgi:hypothetical protein